MDAQRFDAFTRGMAGPGWTRRGLTRLAAGAAVAFLLGGAVPETAAKKRKPRPKPKKCKNGSVKCGKTCVNTQTNALHCGRCGRRCGSNIPCVNGECQGGGCPGDQILCGQLCVDPNTDEEHCGECNTRCQGDLTCIGGDCGCAEGTRCGNQCVDTQTDAEHCGDCNQDCDNNETCVGGQCNPSGCGSGERVCGGGLCIPERDDACCVPSDCGSSRFGNDISCNLNTHRCQCRQAGWGICAPRASDGGAQCAPCCSGGNGVCGGERVCLSQLPSGCGCPPARPDACSGFFTEGLCSLDFDTDSQRCGPNCVDCTQNGTAFACCVDGQCVGLAGCGPNTSSPSCVRSHCGTCGAICGDEAPVCCNDGPGTTGQCKAPLSGGFCPPP